MDAATAHKPSKPSGKGVHLGGCDPQRHQKSVNFPGSDDGLVRDLGWSNTKAFRMDYRGDGGFHHPVVIRGLCSLYSPVLCLCTTPYVPPS